MPIPLLVVVSILGSILYLTIGGVIGIICTKHWDNRQFRYIVENNKHDSDSSLFILGLILWPILILALLGEVIIRLPLVVSIYVAKALAQKGE